MIDVIPPKRISPDCPFKSNQRLTKISILTPLCAFWLHCVQFDSSVGGTWRSLTLRWVVRRGAFWEILITWLRGVMHTEELDSVVGRTPQSSTQRWDAHSGVILVWNFEYVCFLCFRICNIFKLLFSKNFWSKKDSLNNVWLTVLFSYYYLQTSQRNSKSKQTLGKLLTPRCDALLRVRRIWIQGLLDQDWDFTLDPDSIEYRYGSETLVSLYNAGSSSNSSILHCLHSCRFRIWI